MSPTIKFNLMIETTSFMWNGTPYTLSGSCELLPDNQVKHLHRRVLGFSRDERVKVPVWGKVVGRVKRSNSEYFYLVENESTGRLEKIGRVEVVEGK